MYICFSDVMENLPPFVQLHVNVERNLKISDNKARDIERNKHQQWLSSLWFSVRQYDITSSLFRNILTWRATTPLDSLVLHIIQPRSFSTAATRYGTKNNEQVALKEYIAYQQSHGYPESATSASGYIINPAYPFLGASPDGAVYDPSNV